MLYSFYIDLGNLLLIFPDVMASWMDSVLLSASVKVVLLWKEYKEIPKILFLTTWWQYSEIHTQALRRQ